MFTLKNVFFGLLSGCLMLVSSQVCAAVITVNSTFDSYPYAGNDGRCTLREAIDNADDNFLSSPDCLVAGEPYPVVDEIRFDIPGSGVRTIQVKSSPLPGLWDSVIIDGTSQPGSSCGSADDLSDRHLLIELDGSDISGNGNGALQLLGGPFGAAPDHSYMIRGLIINDFGSGIYTSGPIKSASITCNHIGINASGTAAEGNGWGVYVNGGEEIIVGGNEPGEANIISGNNKGVLIGYGTTIVKGNRIGTNVSGQTAIPNETYGIDAYGGQGMVVNNIISGNGDAGVVVRDEAKLSILENYIFANGALGIDLKRNGVTPNDSGDGDDGVNHLLNFPVLTSAGWMGDKLTVQFNLDVDASRTRRFHIEFFDNPSGLDPTGYGEGQRYLGFADVTTDTAPGSTSHTVVFALPSGINPETLAHLTSTATEYPGDVKTDEDDLDGGMGRFMNTADQADYGATSEFSTGIDIDRVFYDYGDAPDPSAGTAMSNYRTRKSDLGASHKVGKIRLGRCVDGDSGELQGYGATADDSDISSDVWGACVEGDDEDGLTVLTSPVVPGRPVLLKFNVAGDVYSGYLNGWIDWNRDGRWSSDEHVISDHFVLVGSESILSVTVPSWVGADVYARFRVSTQSGLTPYLQARDGEVEDYKIVVPLPKGGEGEIHKWTPVKDPDLK